MSDAKKMTAFRQKRIVREMIDYCLNFVYLACFFAFFTWYRRLILASYQIVYLEYGISLIEAAILAKVVMVGQVLGLGRGLEERPLIFPVLYKTVVFSVWAGFLSVIEHTARGFLQGKGLASGFHELAGGRGYELLAKCLVVFFAFIPFFAIKELSRVLGEGRIRKLFFRRRPTL